MTSDTTRDSEIDFNDNSFSSSPPKTPKEKENNSLSQEINPSNNSTPIPLDNKWAMTSLSSINQNDKESQIPLTQKTILSCFRTKNTTMILQKIINEASIETIDTFVKELTGCYNEIIIDKNGNYFCSDLFRVCSQEHRIKILKELTKNISDICVNKCGNNPIKVLVEYSSCEKEYELILDSFNDYNKLIYASYDSYGSYVIQKIFEHIPEKFRMKFNLLFITFIPYICLKQYGLCSCKKLVLNTKNEDLIEKIVNLIRKDFLKISMNNYGNFLIQEILKKWNNTIQGKKLKEDIIYNFRVLSANKYAYYICDLFLKIATKEEKLRLINTIPFNNTDNINGINNNSFPNNFVGMNPLYFGENNIFNSYMNSINGSFSNNLAININNNNINQNFIPFSKIVFNGKNNNVLKINNNK